MEPSLSHVLGTHAMLLNDEKGGTMFFQEGAKLSPPTAWMPALALTRPCAREPDRVLATPAARAPQPHQGA